MGGFFDVEDGAVNQNGEVKQDAADRRAAAGIVALEGGNVADERESDKGNGGYPPCFAPEGPSDDDAERRHQNPLRNSQYAGYFMDCGIFVCEEFFLRRYEIKDIDANINCRKGYGGVSDYGEFRRIGEGRDCGENDNQVRHKVLHRSLDERLLGENVMEYRVERQASQEEKDYSRDNGYGQQENSGITSECRYG